ncbi:MAG: metal-dependent hydrolase [Candidatus Altiarchaeota archaeon]|nr:metal-dependent hydrolase [Candidatus Altiarchaeota archaeon]
MPLTPFHLGPAIFLGLLLLRYINLPTFLVASTIVDLEPFIVLLLGLDHPLHGFFHSFLGGSIVAVTLSLIMVRLGDRIQKLMSHLRLEQNTTKKSIWLASFTGIYLHILLDSPLYGDIRPFYPMRNNPLYSNSMFIGLEIHGLCVLTFLAGAILYGYLLVKKSRHVR